MKDIAKLINERRKELGLKKADVAKRANVTYQTLWNIEQGKSITFQTLNNILDTLDLTIKIETK